MKDVSPELLKSIMDDFEKDLDSSSVRKQLLKVIEEGTATYKEANEYAIEVGEILAKAFQNNLSSEVLPEGHMYYNIAQKVVAEPMKNNYKLVSRACADVQTSLNRSVGLGLNGVTPNLNQDRIQGILNLISGKDQFDDIKYMLDEPVVNFTQSVVDDTIKKNAEKQYLSGLSPKIKRTSTGKCCKWCDRLVGTYEYASVRNTGNDVFRRHKHCRCTVEFITNGKVQNVHTKKWVNDKNSIAKNTDFGIIKSGAVNGALTDKNDPLYTRREKHAVAYYESVRNSKKSFIVKRISANSGFSEKYISKVYDHVFMNEYELLGRKKRFDPDYDMAESFKRLREGKNIKEHDIILLEHEHLEYGLMNRFGFSYSKAHDLAQRKYNYKEALDKFKKDNNL